MAIILTRGVVMGLQPQRYDWLFNDIEDSLNDFVFRMSQGTVRSMPVHCGFACQPPRGFKEVMRWR